MNLRIGFANCQGTTGKRELFRRLLKKYDLLILAETWMTNSSSTPSSALIRLTIPNNSGRGRSAYEGVMVLGKKSIRNYVDVIHLADDNRWFCLRCKDVFIMGGYFPPNNELLHLQQFLDYANLTRASDPDIPLVLIGDFNARHSRVRG